MTTHDVPDWRADAACIEVGGELFFPETGDARAAKRICRTCPVITQCLEDAQTNLTRYGVQGGLTAKERRALRGTVI